MLYEIITDCRIANKDYHKGDIVSCEEVEYFPSVMIPVSWKAPVKAPEKVEEPKEVKTSKKSRSKRK